MVSNSTSFSDIASKCISSRVPVTNPSCNINFDNKSYPLSCSGTTSKSFLSAVSQINTSCNVKSNDKSYSLSYSKVFSKPIVKDMKYSSFNIEDPPPLEDGVLSDGPESSCIYKSKYDVATYREKAPHLSYSEKVDLIKNVFVPEKKTFAFQKQLDLLNMSGYCCFPGFVILPVRIHLTACLVFCLVMISLLKFLGLKIYFHSPSELGQVLFLTLKLIVKAKRRKLILHMNLFKAFTFQHDLNLKLFSLKSKAQDMKLICYVIENINMRLKKIVKY